MNIQSKTLLQREIASNIIHLIRRWESSINWFRWKSQFVREIFFVEYINAMKKYLLANKKKKWYSISSFNPLLDLCFKTGILDDTIIWMYSTIYTSKSFSKKLNIKLFSDPTWTLGLFFESYIHDTIPLKAFNLSDPQLVYTDLVSIMFIKNKIKKYMVANKDVIKDILVTNHWLWSFKR